MTRSLLIDNYDSYTYNLFNLMTQVNGAEPIVRRHDDPRCLDDLKEVDCVVISPGPGDPRNPADFGMCSEILEVAQVPVLGVCLGHQGVGGQHGAQVGRAPAPKHGFVSRVHHNGDVLFQGIPQDFEAVRYHSLCVREPLPAELEALAWSEDGVVMGLRHRERPQWGVQFHPESVLTQYGAGLLGNFRDIVERSRGDAGPVRQGSPDRPARAYTAHTRRLGLALAGDVVFEELMGGSSRAAWLDSAAPGPGSGRFSYLTLASDSLGEVLSYRRGDGSVLVQAVGRDSRRVPGSIFDVLDAELADRTIVAPEVPFDFTGGFVGYFGYELKGDTGASVPHQSDLPDAMWIFADRLAVIDHSDGGIHLVALSTDDSASQDDAAAWLDSAASKLETATAAATDEPAEEPADERAEEPAAERLRALAVAALDRDEATYHAGIAAIMDKLVAGESYEVCLTNMLRLPRPPSAFEFYRTLRRRNAAPYSAFLDFGSVQVASSSPERFLKLTKDRVVEAKPIKGTAPRGATADADRKLRDELSASDKTLAENLMIADLLRNDLSQVCVPGSVHVPALMRVESYATVHQLVSTIRGRLRDCETAVSCVRACFPGGSMTGAPKRRTMEIIDELEGGPRGIYSGAIGYLACNGTADLNIVIRTAVFAGDELRIGAGGAIVLDSDPDEEYEEMLIKAMAPLAAYPDVSARPAHQLAATGGP